MKVSYEIPSEGELQEILCNGRVSYRFRGDDGTYLFVITDNEPKVPGTTVSKYQKARIKVIIDYDDQYSEYEGVET